MFIVVHSSFVLRGYVQLHIFNYALIDSDTFLASETFI